MLNFMLFYLFLGGVILQGERVQGIFGKNKIDKSSVKRIIRHVLKGSIYIKS